MRYSVPIELKKLPRVKNKDEALKIILEIASDKREHVLKDDCIEWLELKLKAIGVLAKRGLRGREPVAKRLVSKTNNLGASPSVLAMRKMSASQLIASGGNKSVVAGRSLVLGANKDLDTCPNCGRHVPFSTGPDYCPCEDDEGDVGM